MKPKILVFGNSLVKIDSLSIKMIPELKKKFPEFYFIEADSTESLEYFGQNLNIIDVSSGIKQTKFLEIKNEKDLEKLKIEKITSMHDFDLGYNLKLLMRAKKIKSTKIICLPLIIRKKQALREVSKLLSKIS